MRSIALILALVVGIIAPLIVAADDVGTVLYDTDAWVAATSTVLADDEARTALSTIMVDRTLDSIGCIVPGAGLLRGLGVMGRLERRGTDELSTQLDRPVVRRAWERTMRESHEGFLDATDETGSVTATGLLDLIRIIEVSSRLLERVLPASVDGDRITDCLTGSSDDGARLLDADAAATVIDAARSWRWLTTAPPWIGGALAALLAVAVIIGSLRRALGGVIAAFGAGVFIGALVASTWLDRTLAQLTDGIASEAEQTLATRVLAAGTSTIVDHLDAAMLLGIGLIVVGVVIAATQHIVRRRRPDA